MISDRIQAFLSDPQGFFQNSDNVFFATIMVFFVVFTAARLLSLRQSQYIPIVMGLIMLLALLQNGLLILNAPTLFFLALVVIAVIVGLRYLPRLRWPG
jgi:hypothetical protein